MYFNLIFYFFHSLFRLFSYAPAANAHQTEDINHHEVDAF